MTYDSVTRASSDCAQQKALRSIWVELEPAGLTARPALPGDLCG